MQSYKVPTSRATATLEEKKSQFIGLCAPAGTEAEALAVLEEVRAAHRTANHNVYAYVLRHGARQRYSDDGEPAKTAGLPVLEVINHAGLTNCIVVVTRYFGGTLLGTGGLVRAYTAAAKAATTAAGASVITSCVRITLRIEYALYEQARRLLEAAGCRLESEDFGERVTLAALLPAGQEPPLLEQLQQLCRGNADVALSQPFFTAF